MRKRGRSLEEQMAALESIDEAGEAAMRATDRAQSRTDRAMAKADAKVQRAFDKAERKIVDATAKAADKVARSTRVARDAQPRPLTDAREMRALAHPIRIAILEALTREGPLTATEAAEIVGESPANCSFHLRTLAKYGFVEEAEGGSGRQRPWRRVSLGQMLDDDFADDAEAEVAAHALANMSLERAFDRLRHFSEIQSSFPLEWRDANWASNMLLYLTPSELREIGEAIHALVMPYSERSLDRKDRPPGSGPVHVAVFGHPLPPTPSGN